ncbi:MAG: response regulator [Azospirillum sp.]|nr:response regulator [Azospirillum sp.]
MADMGPAVAAAIEADIPGNAAAAAGETRHRVAGNSQRRAAAADFFGRTRLNHADPPKHPSLGNHRRATSGVLGCQNLFATFKPNDQPGDARDGAVELPRHVDRFAQDRDRRVDLDGHPRIEQRHAEINRQPDQRQPGEGKGQYHQKHRPIDQIPGPAAQQHRMDHAQHRGIPHQGDHQDGGKSGETDRLPAADSGRRHGGHGQLQERASIPGNDGNPAAQPSRAEPSRPTPSPPRYIQPSRFKPQISQPARPRVPAPGRSEARDEPPCHKVLLKTTLTVKVRTSSHRPKRSRYCVEKQTASDRKGDVVMKRVLIVDDAEEVRFSLGLALSGAGFEVQEAPDGREALRLLSESLFDLLVTDLWMPGVDGIALLKRIRTEQPRLKVLVVSGGGPHTPLDFSDALARTWGADGVLLKPIATVDLLCEVNRLLTPVLNPR